MLAFKIELQRWRCAEIEAGQGDPVRLVYENIFNVSDSCIIYSVHVDLHHFLVSWHYRALA